MADLQGEDQPYTKNLCRCARARGQRSLRSSIRIKFNNCQSINQSFLEINVNFQNYQEFV
jgi:hypothetical protein